MKGFSFSCFLICLLITSSVKAAEVTYSWGFPRIGNWWVFLGFGFGGANSSFNGWHVAEDTKVSYTPYGTEIFSPCSGTVKISDESSFSGYGSASSANPYYKGYVLLIECSKEDGSVYTVLLGHVQPGSNNYDAKNHIGLAPKDKFVAKGQYVGRVNHYYPYADTNTDWPHIHIGIRKGAYNPSKQADYVVGYLSTGWNATHTFHDTWVAPTAFIKANSMQSSWHPDGTLVQVYGSSDIYQLIDGQLHLISNEEVFNAHAFKWGEVVFISQQEFSCYDISWEINWKPYREIGIYNGYYYMIEKNNINDVGGALYKFMSNTAWKSWDLDYLPVKNLTLSQYNDWLAKSGTVYNLYARNGTVIQYKGAPINGIPADSYFITNKNGAISRFATAKAFWSSGFDFDDVVVSETASDFFASFVYFENEITEAKVSSCKGVPVGGGQGAICVSGDLEETYAGPINTLNVGECQGKLWLCDDFQWVVIQEEILPTTEIKDGLDNDCDGQTDEGLLDLDKDKDGYTSDQGDCNDLNKQIYPSAEELCDNLDNDCDGATDENLSQPCQNICGYGEVYCVAGKWKDCNLLVYNKEICDGFDNDCDGLTDEGVKNACGLCGAVPNEICDGFDNDCDGLTDEGVKNACGLCGAVPNEICDGFDNDCDGLTDEGVKNACGLCGAVPNEICDGFDNDCDGLTDEGVKNACGLCGAVPNEICDGFDNDCDGLIDEGVKNACGLCGAVPNEICDGFDNDCDGLTDEGVKNACGLCGAVPNEICDGLDNDCDNQTDESCVNDPQDGLIVCWLSCNYYDIYLWWGDSKSLVVTKAELNASGLSTFLFETTKAEICERGQAYFDYNCVQPGGGFYNPAYFSAVCSTKFTKGYGKIDFAGEGELWFTEFTCDN